MKNNRSKIGFVLVTLYFVLSPLILSAQQVLTLDSCLAYAKQRNCTIQSAQLEVAVSREMKKQMLWMYFPQVGLNGFAFSAIRPLIEIDVREVSNSPDMKDFLSELFNIIKETDPESNVDPIIRKIRWGVSAQGQVLQPIFWGGQIVNANKLAKLGIEASQLKQAVSERDVLQEVTETYWLISGLIEKQATIDKAIALLDTISEVAQVAFNNGLVTNNDLLRVKLKQNEIQTNAIKLKNGIELASRFLCHMIGVEYTKPLIVEQIATNNIMENLPAEPDRNSAENRPEYQLLNVNVRYNQLMKKLTLGEALPHLAIGFSGGYSNYFERDKWNGIAFASLSIPLTQWGQTAHKLKQQNFKIKQAMMMQDDLNAKLNLQNRQTYDNLIEAAKLTDQHQAAEELAEDNYQRALMNYRAGVATMTELLEAEALLLQAKNNLTDSRINYRTTLRKYTEYTKQK